jgi:ketosteroid isomerase-like protein
MSKENVEIIREFYSETERGNFWVARFFHPEVRVVWLDSVGIEKETVGLRAMSATLLAWLEPYEDVTLSADRIVDAGDRVVVVATWRGRGKASGAVTELNHGTVWTVEDGEVTSLESYDDPRGALEAGGVTE